VLEVELVQETRARGKQPALGGVTIAPSTERIAAQLDGLQVWERVQSGGVGHGGAQKAGDDLVDALPARCGDLLQARGVLAL
jgi:predicted Rdx family selenoprotein